MYSIWDSVFQIVECLHLILQIALFQVIENCTNSSIGGWTTVPFFPDLLIEKKKLHLSKLSDVETQCTEHEVMLINPVHLH